jgi:predicted nucleotide-binding protein
MEDRHIDALRRIGQADREWARGGHQPTIFHLLHGGGMESRIDHPAWDSSWATPAEQTIDDLGELRFLRVEPHDDKRRSFDLTMSGRERSEQLREEIGMIDGDPPAAQAGERRARGVAEESVAAAGLEVEMFLARSGGEVFSVDQLAAAVANPKFESRAAVAALRDLRAAGRVEPHAGGWQVSGEPVARYHVRVAPEKAADQLAGAVCVYDLTMEEVLERFVAPYQERLPLTVDGRELNSYRKPKITMTGAPGSAAVAKIASGLKGSDAADTGRRAAELFFERSSKDVTADYIDPGEPATVSTSPAPAAVQPSAVPGEEIFIVHGHSRRDEVDLFLRDATGRRPIILADRAIEGRTIIEKFEQESGGSGFAVVLLTADDLGRSKAAPEAGLAPRARQNVILELGYFIARLGRRRVVALYEEGVELPSDYGGVGFISFADDWKLKLIRELRVAGFEVDVANL